MAEPHRDPELNAPQNPPNSVLRPSVRSTAVRTYLGAIVLFFAVVAITSIYWATRPAREIRDIDEDVPGVAGTSGETQPGGHDPDPRPDNPPEELEARGGQAITDLQELFEEGGRGTIGRRVEITDATIERIDSPTAFWIRSDDARIAVVAPTMADRVTRGQAVDLTGTIERVGNELRIRAARVETKK